MQQTEVVVFPGLGSGGWFWLAQASEIPQKLPHQVNAQGQGQAGIFGHDGSGKNRVSSK